MTTLVIAEHDQQRLHGATLNTVAAALRLGGEVHVLVAGGDCAAVAAQAARLQGVTKVLLADAPHYAAQTAENLAALVVAHAAPYSHILAPASTYGKNALPRVAALLDVAQISEISAIVSPDTFVRPIMRAMCWPPSPALTPSRWQPYAPRPSILSPRVAMTP